MLSMHELSLQTVRGCSLNFLGGQFSSAVAVLMVVAAFLIGDPLSSSSASGGPGAMLTSSSEHEARFASTSTSTQEDSKQVRPLLINAKDHGDNLPNQKTTSVCLPACISSFNLFLV